MQIHAKCTSLHYPISNAYNTMAKTTTQKMRCVFVHMSIINTMNNCVAFNSLHFCLRKLRAQHIYTEVSIKWAVDIVLAIAAHFVSIYCVLKCYYCQLLNFTYYIRWLGRLIFSFILFQHPIWMAVSLQLPRSLYHLVSTDRLFGHSLSSSSAKRGDRVNKANSKSIWLPNCDCVVGLKRGNRQGERERERYRRF